MRTIRCSARLAAPCIAATLALACESPTTPANAGLDRASVSTDMLPIASANGGGHYLLQGTIDVQFAFGAVQQPSGEVAGQFHQTLIFQGELLDFDGTVTCLAFDPATNHAWIGGVITSNRSTHPYYMQDLFQPGHDVWFRVVDYGEGATAAQPDRTTFLGFEDNPTIKSSAQYCAEKPWPEGDARTWPVTEGNIQVR